MGMTALALIGALLLLLGIVALCGLLLGYFAQKYKIEATRSSKKSTPSCRKPSAANAASPAANPTPKPSPKARQTSTAARPGGQEGVEKTRRTARR